MLLVFTLLMFCWEQGGLCWLFPYFVLIYSGNYGIYAMFVFKFYL